MAKETERKFLVLNPPSLEGLKYVDIRQGYVAIDSDAGNEVRVRQADNQYILTIKSKGDLERLEVENEISKKDFEELWKVTNGRYLMKRRYYLPFQNWMIEIDQYKGILAGLWVAEIEFDDIKESNLFKMPAWMDREVTFDKRFKNQSLAQLRDANFVNQLYEFRK